MVQGSNEKDREYNTQIRSQIYEVCKLIVDEKAFEIVDTNQYFHVFWLHKMIEQLPTLCDDVSFNPKWVELFKSLYA